MQLKALGYTAQLKQYRNDNELSSFLAGRVIAEHKDRYTVQSEDGVYNAELLGNLRYTAENRYDLPAVGDWVAFSEYDETKALIHKIYPRTSVIERQAIGKSTEVQIIASNVDYGLIVQSVNRDFNLNRLERYQTICHASNIKPVIVLSKIDLVDAATLSELIDQVKSRMKEILVIPLSNTTHNGHKQIASILKEGITYCLLGSSGVGKSTLINSMLGKEHMPTKSISESIDRGKHTTSHRELIVLEQGGILIDNPGMREVGMTDSSAGNEMTFQEIYTLAENCRFNDCTHTNEKGCAILEAIEIGDLDTNLYANFQKLQREQAHYTASALEKKNKDKNFGKMIKTIKKDRKQNKY